MRQAYPPGRMPIVFTFCLRRYAKAVDKALPMSADNRSVTAIPIVGEAEFPALKPINVCHAPTGLKLPTELFLPLRKKAYDRFMAFDPIVDLLAVQVIH
ncbi:MAG TPA: hypothetical protein VL094_07800 [Sphingomonadaceae bacterium]|nr:hypothetical protein [Sphingomonadaceae bacterium]